MEALCEPEVEQPVIPQTFPQHVPVYSTLLVMGLGKKQIQWDRNDPAQVAEARAKFDEFVGRGYLAYKLVGSSQGEVLGTFDPSAESTVLHAAMVGG